MKLKIFLFSLFLFLSLNLSACSNVGNSVNATPSTPQYTLGEGFDFHLKTNNISGEVLYFTADCFNGTDKMQAFAVVGNGNTGDLWFTDNNSYKKLLNNITVTKAPTVVQTSSKAIYILNGVRQSFAYIVTDTEAIQLEGAGENLTSMGKDDFFTLVTDDTQQKKYYLYFDGYLLKEYGGIYITESEFLKLNKSEAILNSIAECGYSVTEIIYRANGFVNINCEKQTDGVSLYENVTVKVLGKNAICIPSGLAQDADYVGRSSYGGKYTTAAFPDIATYPDKFLVE